MFAFLLNERTFSEQIESSVGINETVAVNISSVNPVVMRYITFHFPLLQKRNVLPGKDFVSRGTTKKLENARKE